MAYPKRTDFEKTAFIAQVFNLLKFHDKMVQYKNLDKETDLDKKYEDALRYSREMGYMYKDVVKTSHPKSDLDIVTAPIDEVIDETEEYMEETAEGEEETATVEPEFKVNNMTAKEVQERLHKPSRRYSKQVQQDSIKRKIKERKKELMERHYEILDWLQCIDDGIIKGDVSEARQMVNKLTDYADRLDALMKRKYYDRAVSLLKQFNEITASMQDYEVREIKRKVEELAPQYAMSEVGE